MRIIARAVRRPIRKDQTADKIACCGAVRGTAMVPFTNLANATIRRPGNASTTSVFELLQSCGHCSLDLLLHGAVRTYLVNVAIGGDIR